MNLDNIRTISKDQVVTHAQIVVNYQPQKKKSHRVRINAGGTLLKYIFEFTTRTADVTKSKVMQNSTISMGGVRYICADAGNVYLATLLYCHEYMRIHIELVQE